MTTRARRPPVKHRNRFDVKVFFKDGASLQWISHKSRSLPAAEMVTELRKIADLIEGSARDGDIA